MSVTVLPIKAFSDNYIWCLSLQQNCVIVDPGDAEPVLAHCKKHQLTLKAILITHHHWDHTNGLPALLEAFPGIPVYGPNNPAIKEISHPLKQGDELRLDDLAISFSIYEVPGHTLDHIAFYSELGLFCGDTLFSAGCGRLFEGSPEQMLASLSTLATLPSSTPVYCTHEYTQSNINFALAVEPTNQALLKYRLWANEQRKNAQPTLPSSIATECQVNPFLRCDSVELVNSVNAHWQANFSQKDDIFAALRRWKDNF